MKGTRIALIGGGSVATAFLFHLVQGRETCTASAEGTGDALEVLVFEPRTTIGRGGAYDDDLDSNLLNVTAGNMSVAGDDRLHFFRWLQEQGITQFRGQAIGQDTFLPRALFGRYLEAVYQNLHRRSEAAGIRLRHIGRSVIDLESLDEDVCQVRTEKCSHRVHRVVLAMGNLQSTAFVELKGADGYFDSPYLTSVLARSIPRSASVCVLGTSLSAVDAVAALACQGHTGPIWCVSRHGRLPSVRGLKNFAIELSSDFLAQLDTRLAEGRLLPLAMAMDLVHQELALQGVDVEEVLRLAESAADALTYLDKEINESATRPRQWQAFGNALNPVIEKLWHLLSADDRRTFEKTLRPLWMARRVTFPIENARTLQALLRTRQLSVTGGFAGVTPDDAKSGFRIQLQPTLSAGMPGLEPPPASLIQADVVINATSFSSDAARSDIPLLRRLLDKGMAVADEFGGLKLDFATGYLLCANGKIDPRITVLGTLACGTYFWTNSMDINARLAKAQADLLVKNLQPPQHCGRDLPLTQALGNPAP